MSKLRYLFAVKVVLMPIFGFTLCASFSPSCPYVVKRTQTRFRTLKPTLPLSRLGGGSCARIRSDIRARKQDGSYPRSRRVFLRYDVRDRGQSHHGAQHLGFHAIREESEDSRMDEPHCIGHPCDYVRVSTISRRVRSRTRTD